MNPKRLNGDYKENVFNFKRKGKIFMFFVGLVLCYLRNPFYPFVERG